MKFSLPKTHYEISLERLVNLKEVFPQSILEMTDPTYPEFASALSNRSAHVTNVLFHFFHMKQCGEKIYYISPGLSSRLAQTSVDVDSYFLKSPFREIYVQIEPGLFFIRKEGDIRVPVTGFYIYLREIEGKKQVRVVAAHMGKIEDGKVPDESVFYFKIVLEPGKIQQQIKQHIEENVKNDLASLEKYGGLRNVEYLEEFFNFVFNILLYITSKNPDLSEYDPLDYMKKLQGLKSAAKIRKVEQKALKRTTRSIIVVGANVHGQIEEIQKSGGIGAWKLSKQVKVSGYWRIQWYGSEKNNSKYAETIWIDDYTKGPEFSDMVHSKYVVKG